VAIKIKNSTIIDDSRNLVDVGISTVTSLSIGSTEVINSSRQLKNIASLDATTTATIESAIANAPNTFTDLNVTGISTLNVVSANSLNVSGIGTITTLNSNTGTIDFLSGTSINASGIVTATTFDGNLATSNLTGTITNSQLAGFITNDKLVNSSVNFGGVTVSLGGTDATPAFDLQDATGLPISTGVSGLGANVATFLATPSSSNLASAVTDETGSGALVFANSPTLVSPTLGAASATSLTASGAVTANNYNVGTDVGISTTRTIVATTSATTIDSFAIATYRSARVQVQITQGTDYQTSDVLIIHDGSTASVIEYASIATDDYLGTFTGLVSGGNCLLQINMSSSSSATVKVLSQKITV
jgi:hypothetical protein